MELLLKFEIMKEDMELSIKIHKLRKELKKLKKEEMELSIKIHKLRLRKEFKKLKKWIKPLGNQGRSCFRPHVAKSYFETYKSYDHMQNFRPLSQKFSEISRFEKFEFLRFCLTLTHRNCHNSLNF